MKFTLFLPLGGCNSFSKDLQAKLNSPYFYLWEGVIVLVRIYKETNFSLLKFTVKARQSLMKHTLVNGRICFTSWYKSGLIDRNVWRPKKKSKMITVTKKKKKRLKRF